ncbi:MAG TPA: hypothetical protein VKY31_07050 [Terriglobia bacterium]|nr:hypothetical protein [Terriglobia bacterium]
MRRKLGLSLLIVSCVTGTLWGQLTTPPAGLTTLGVIPVPNWSATAASFDLFSFNPNTRILYQADSTNHGVIAIDTATNTIHGILSLPNCTGRSCPSGVQVVPDLQKLVATSRSTTLWIYDLDTPGSAPATLTVPDGSDELDYDPIHQRIYVANTTAPYFLTGIDLTGPNANTIVASIPLPGAPEQPRFNPVNGLIYQTVPSAGIVVVDPTAGASGTGAVVNTILGRTDCGPQGNDIDPVTNTMLISCVSGTGKGEELLNLADGSVVNFFPNAQGTDVLKFNPNNRRWYTGSSGSPNGGICTSISTTNPAALAWPIIGVFAAGSSPGATTFVGGQCSGRSSRVAAVDTIGNNVYVPTPQYPADPSSTTTGTAGILVMNDQAPTQPTPARSQAVLGANGTVTFTLQGRTMNVFANLQGLVDAPTRLVVTTTAANEVVPCYEAGGQAMCTGTTVGDPLIGGVVLLGNNAKVLSQGTIASVPPIIVTGITFDVTNVKIGSAFNATIAGSNLSAQTYFDVRVRAPGSSAETLAPNWQTGTSVSHTVPTGTATGTWTVDGVRPHQDPADHTGSFVPVSAVISVGP